MRMFQSRRSCLCFRISSRTDFCSNSSCGRFRKKLVSLTVRFSSSSASSARPSRLWRRWLALPHHCNGFRGLLELPEFGLAQEPGNVQENNQTPFQFADSGHIAGFTFREYGAGGFDFGGRNLQYFRRRADDESDQLVFELDDQNAVLFVVLDGRAAESLAQVHHGNDLSAQVDYALDQVRRAGHRRDLRNPHDFPYGTNANAVRFTANAKSDDLEFFLHAGLSASGTRHLGVFELAGVLRRQMAPGSG